jgi:hypothetical protein
MLHQVPIVVAKVDRLTRLSRLLDAGVDVRFADLPTIEGPTGRFMLQQMASVADRGRLYQCPHEVGIGRCQESRQEARRPATRIMDLYARRSATR